MPARPAEAISVEGTPASREGRSEEPPAISPRSSAPRTNRCTGTVNEDFTLENRVAWRIALEILRCPMSIECEVSRRRSFAAG